MQIPSPYPPPRKIEKNPLPLSQIAFLFPQSVIFWCTLEKVENFSHFILSLFVSYLLLGNDTTCSSIFFIFFTSNCLNTFSSPMAMAELASLVLILR